MTKNMLTLKQAIDLGEALNAAGSMLNRKSFEEVAATMAAQLGYPITAANVRHVAEQLNIEWEPAYEPRGNGPKLAELAGHIDTARDAIHNLARKATQQGDSLDSLHRRVASIENGLNCLRSALVAQGYIEKDGRAAGVAG